MRVKYIITGLFILTLIIIAGCTVALNENQMVFVIKDVYYQSWMVNEEEKGTDLFIELNNIDKDIEFTEIIFRGIKVPLNKVSEGKVLTLKASLVLGQSILEQQENEVTGQSDRLVYRYKDIEYSYPLPHVRRLETKIREGI